MALTKVNKMAKAPATLRQVPSSRGISMASPSHSAKRRSQMVIAAIFAISIAGPVYSQELHHHDQVSGKAPAPFIASTAKPFSALMDDAMVVMENGMKRAPMNGVPEHDFVTMMIPHHQGAIDMAKALLLYTKDPELMNLAQGIITEQQNEIRVMKAWLQRYEQQHAGAGKPTR